MSLPRIADYPVCSIDVETDGKDWLRNRVFGVSVAVPGAGLAALLQDPVNSPVTSIYFDVRRQPHLYEDLREQAPGLPLVVNHNIKFDLHMLINDRVYIPPERCECTMIRASLINEHRTLYNLDALGKDYLGIGKHGDVYAELAEIFGGRPTRNAQILNLHRAPIKIVEPYARRDTELALRLWAWQQGEIQRQDLHGVWGLEKRLFPHILKMERHGIRVDEEEAERRVYALDEQIVREQKELNDAAGFEINPNPSGSIHQLFAPEKDERGVWRAKDGTVLGTTDAGKPSINADALERMRDPRAAKILKLRKAIKTRDTFIKGHVLGYAYNGRVHPNINQVKGDETGGTGTGRLSYTTPALQQIPSRDKEVAAMVRPIFLPDEGQGWSYGDLDQHELRVFHHYVNNPTVVEQYRKNPDLDGHGIIAELTGLPRSAPKAGGANAKQVNLGMVFNMGGGELADQMGLPFEWDSFTDRQGRVHEFKKAGPEALEVMETYYRMVPGVREIGKKARSIAASRGFVRTIFGRNIRFPGGQFTHKASGLIYQGSSADLVKLDIINTMDYLESECPEGSLLLSIHDEQNISMPPDNAKHHLGEIQNLIQTRPGSPTKLRVPIRADFSELGGNWWDATQKGSIHG